MAEKDIELDEELKDRITVIDADITDESLSESLKDIHVDTIINCAACVKHFSDSDILERINGGIQLFELLLAVL